MRTSSIGLAAARSLAILLAVSSTAFRAEADVTLTEPVSDECPGIENGFGGEMALLGRGTLVVGNPGEYCGQVHLFDGRTGAVLKTLRDPDDFSFGTSVAVVRRDLLVGSRRPRVRRIDPRTNDVRVTYEFPGSAIYRFGYPVVAVGRFVVVGQPDAHHGPGVVHVFDGASGALLHTIPNPDPTKAGFGQSLGRIGSRLLVTAAPPVRQGDATIYVIDPRDGAVRATLVSPEPGDGFGEVAAHRSTIVVGSPYATGGGAVHVFDRRGRLQRTLRQPEVAWFGFDVALAGTRLLVGAPNTTVNEEAEGAALLLDLHTGTLLGRWDGIGALGFFGGNVKLLPTTAAITGELEDIGWVTLVDLP